MNTLTARRPIPAPPADGPFARAGRAAIQRTVLFPLLGAVCDPQVTVATPAELRPPLIVVANHASDLDCPLLLLALPAPVRRDLAVAAAADRFYRGRLVATALHLGLGTIPFDRGRGSAESLDVCASLLRSGTSVLVFPEGTRSRDGAMGRFRSGAARLSLATGTPVLPAGIRGAHAALPPGARMPRRGQTSVHVGEPILPRPGEDVWVLTARLEDAVRALAGEPVRAGSVD